MEYACADDAPIDMIFKVPPALGEAQKDPPHSANFGVKLQEKLDGLGVGCEVVYPGAPEVRHKSTEDFLVHTLKSAPEEARALPRRN